MIQFVSKLRSVYIVCGAAVLGVLRFKLHQTTLSFTYKNVQSISAVFFQFIPRATALSVSSINGDIPMTGIYCVIKPKDSIASHPPKN